MAASLLFLVPLVLLWVLFVRPQQRRMRQAQAMVATLDVGDEIITSGGIYGTITDTDDTSVWVEIAPDVVVRLLRGAVAQRQSPTDLDDLDDDDLDDDDLDDDDAGHDNAGHDDGTDSEVEAPGANGLSAGVPNQATPNSPTAGPTSGDDPA